MAIRHLDKDNKGLEKSRKTKVMNKIKEILSDSFIFLGVLWILCTLSFFPTYKLTSSELVSLDLSPPTILSPGSPFVIHKNKVSSRPKINGKELSLLNNKYYLGVIGLYSKGSSILHGELTPKESNWNPLEQAKLNYSYAPITLP